MQFTLFYQGPLKANGNSRDKHEIRMVLHSQLEELWKQVPLSAHTNLVGRERSDPPHGAIWMEDEFTIFEQVGTGNFAPLVTDKLNLACEIEIRMLRPGPPGQIVSQGGDIDNRLKTLLDALSMPDENQVKSLGAHTMPTTLFCLLKTDLMINSLSVKTDRLLTVVPETNVVLLIHVNVRVVSPTLLNQAFA